MRSRNHARLSLLAALVLTCGAGTSALSFWDWQNIAGFPEACTRAYRATLPDCSARDFGDGAACSVGCAAGVQQVANLVNQQCRGLAADPSTLIGTIFNGGGVGALCPTIADSPGASSGSRASTAMGSTASASTASASAPSTADATSPTSAASTEATATVSASSATEPTSSPTPTSSASPLSSPSSTTTTSPSSTANPNAFGGDVNPFAASADSRSPRIVLLGLISASVVLLLW